MPIDDQVVKIEKWADTGDRTDPEMSTPAIVRTVGYDSTFSGAGGSTPDRGEINQKFRELTGLAVDVRSHGVLPWDVRVDYVLPVLVVASNGRLFTGLVASGPGTSNATDPLTAGQVAWEELTGSQTVPSIPNRPTGIAGNARIDWVWNCPLDGGSEITEFDVQHRRSGASWPVTSITASTSRYLATGLANGRTYQIRVRARNALGRSPDWSPTGSATPQAEVPGRTFGVAASPGDAQAMVSWEPADPRGATITSYIVQWRRAGQSFGTGRQTTTTGTMTTVSSLTNDAIVYFQVRARNSRGFGAWSREASTTPVAPPPPPPPPQAEVPGRTFGVVISPGNARATLNWEPADSRGAPIISYTVQWRGTGQAFGTGRQTTTTNTMVTVSSLTNGVIVYFQVRARNSVGFGEWSRETSTTPVAPPPPPPPPEPSPRRFQSTQNYNWPWSNEDRALIRLVGGSSTDTTVTVGGQTYRASGVRQFLYTVTQDYDLDILVRLPSTAPFLPERAIFLYPQISVSSVFGSLSQGGTDLGGAEMLVSELGRTGFIDQGLDLHTIDVSSGVTLTTNVSPFGTPNDRNGIVALARHQGQIYALTTASPAGFGPIRLWSVDLSAGIPTAVVPPLIAFFPGDRTLRGVGMASDGVNIFIQIVSSEKPDLFYAPRERRVYRIDAVAPLLQRTLLQTETQTEATGSDDWDDRSLFTVNGDLYAIHSDTLASESGIFPIDKTNGNRGVGEALPRGIYRDRNFRVVDASAVVAAPAEDDSFIVTGLDTNDTFQMSVPANGSVEIHPGP